MNEPPVSKFTQRLVGLIERRPILFLLGGLAVVAALAAGLPRIQSDFTHRGYFFSDDPNLQRFDAFERRFGNDDSIVVAVHSPSGVFDSDTAGLLHELTERMWRVPEVIRVDSLTNFSWTHARGDEVIVEPFLPPGLDPATLRQRQQVALRHDLLPGYLVSQDARTALVFARLAPGLRVPAQAPVIMAATREVLGQLRRSDHVFHLAGRPAITDTFRSVAGQDLARLLPLALLVACISVAVSVRSVAGVVAPLVVILLTLLASFGLAGWVGITQNTMSTGIPTVLIAVCVGDSVHLLVGYYQAMSGGRRRREAVRASLEKNLMPTFLTSFTTAVGFLSFLGTQIKPISSFGLMTGFGTLIGWALSYAILGSLLFLLPFRFGPVSGRGMVVSAATMERFVGWVMRKRRAIFAGAILFSGAAVALALRIEVNSSSFRYFSRDVPLRQASEFFRDQKLGLSGVELIVETGVEDGIKDPALLGKVGELQRRIEQISGVVRTLSIVDIVKQIHRAMNGDRPPAQALPADRRGVAEELLLYTMALPPGMDLNDRVSVRSDALRLSVIWSLETSNAANHAVGQILAQARSLGLVVHPTGKQHLYDSTTEYVVWSFARSLVTSVVVIALIIMLFLRSWRIGLLAFPSNLLPVAAGLAALVLLRQPMDMGTVIVASVCLGISVDDTVHVLSNYSRMRRSGVDVRMALTRTMGHAAPGVIANSVILVISFATFALARFTPNFYFGLLTALVLSVALVTELFLTPAIILSSPRLAGATGKSAQKSAQKTESALQRATTSSSSL
jgi:predicted RND superfamily exporter protein